MSYSRDRLASLGFAAILLFGLGGLFAGAQAPPEKAPAVAANATIGVFNARDYGAVGDGVSDDTDAIQAAIDTCIGPGDPVKMVRRAKGTVYLPPGIYRVTKPLRIYSTAYFGLRGEGRSSRIYPVGVMASILDINGIAASTISDLMFEGASNNEEVGSAIYYYQDPAGAACGSAGNVFRNLWLQDVRCEVGFRVGKPGAYTQLDTTVYENIWMQGHWKPGETKWWQDGFHVGSDAWGNTLVHTFSNSTSYAWANGFLVSATNFSLFGGSVGNNGVDFKGNALSYFLVQGVRSDSSYRLLTVGSGPSNLSANFSLTDVLWASENLPADKELIQNTGTNGTLAIRNLAVGVGSKGARVRLDPLRGMSLLLDGVTCSTPLETFLSGCSFRVDRHVRGYTEENPDGTGWVSATRGLMLNAPLRFGGGGAGVIDGSSGPIRMNVEAGSSQSGVEFGDGKGNTTGMITGDGAWLFVHIPDAKAPNQSIFLGAEHWGRPCYKDSAGQVYTLDMSKAKKDE